MKFKTVQDASAKLRTAMQSADPAKFDEAMEEVSAAIGADILEEFRQDMELYKQTGDEKILEKRGCHPLTTKEEAFYKRMVDVMKSDNPKQVFTEIIGSDNEDDIMPSTIIEDVFRNLEQNHPLLSKVRVQNVGYLTKWILNAHTAQTAAWGAINSEITQEITSNLKVVDVKQNKLSCFVIFYRDMFELGPTFLDAYLRSTMREAMAVALETAIVSGTGLNMPIGMDRDLTTLSATGYSQKSATSVTDFAPANYGTLLAGFAKDEDDKQRTFSRVSIICNQEDYLTKIMPATTLLNSAGAYVNNLFPFPTDVIVSDVVETGKAVLGLMDEYILFIGKSARNNVIEYTDDYKFLEDQRVFKVVQYADGRAYDNTSFQLLDISTLNPAYITVKSVDATAA